MKLNKTLLIPLLPLFQGGAEFVAVETNPVAEKISTEAPLQNVPMMATFVECMFPFPASKLCDVPVVSANVGLSNCHSNFSIPKLSAVMATTTWFVILIAGPMANQMAIQIIVKIMAVQVFLAVAVETTVTITIIIITTTMAPINNQPGIITMFNNNKPHRSQSVPTMAPTVEEDLQTTHPIPMTDVKPTTTTITIITEGQIGVSTGALLELHHHRRRQQPKVQTQPMGKSTLLVH